MCGRPRDPRGTAQRVEIVDREHPGPLALVGLLQFAAYIGVVALFRAPAGQRWRVSFSASEAQKSGITIGAHACALSVGAGAAPQGASQSALNQPLSGIHCL